MNGWKYIALSICLLAFHSLRAQNTTILKSDSVKVSVEPHEGKLILKIEHLAHKKSLIGKLMRSVLVAKSNQIATDSSGPPPNPFLCYRGKVIRNIQVKVLDVFGPSINDPYANPQNFLERAGNLLHYNTRTWKIKNYLLFKEGDKVDPGKLRESERLLRQNDYILDSRVLVAGDPNSDSVNVIVLVQDVFSLSGSGDFDPTHESGNIHLQDINFIGLSHRVRTDFHFDPNLKNGWEWSGDYFVPNIYNTYITGDLFYRSQNDNKSYGIDFERNFFSYETKWAGGLLMNWINQQNVIYHNNIDWWSNVGYNTQDAWLGRAFQVQSNKGNRGQWIVAGRAANVTYTLAPQWDWLSPQAFENHQLFLLGGGYTYRKYVRDNYIFGFGRTEDVPEGRALTVTAGIETSPAGNRLYGGVKAWTGHYINWGYVRGGFDLGSFYNAHRCEQGKFSLHLLYFTNMLDIRNFKLRQYLLSRYSVGLNRAAGETFTINDQEGLRGLHANQLTGTQKLTLNYEADLFLPWNVLGFRMAGIAFVDLAWLGNEGDNLFNRRLYQGFGLGLRFKNEHLIFDAIQVSMAYYPGLNPNFWNNWNFLSSTRPYYQFPDFQFTKPDVLPLNGGTY